MYKNFEVRIDNQNVNWKNDSIGILFQKTCLFFLKFLNFLTRYLKLKQLFTLRVSNFIENREQSFAFSII